MSTTAKQNLEDVANRAEDKAAAAFKSAKDDAHNAREQASEIASDLKKSVASGAEATRETLSEAGDKIVGTLRSAAETAGSMPSRVYESVSSVADNLRKRDMSEIVSDAKDYAHRNPGTVAIGAAVAGFALAHLLRAATRESAAERLYHDATRRASDAVARVREGGWRG